MDISKRRCGECGERRLALKTVRSEFKSPWRDYPLAFVTCDLNLWVCGSCKNYVLIGGDAANIDNAMDKSVRDQASQFIDIIRSKTGLTSGQVAELVGVSPQHLSSIHSGKIRPSFSTWNFLKVMATDPVSLVKQANPAMDIVHENMLLRA